MVLFTGQANELDNAGDFFFDQTRIHFLHLQTKCDVLRYIHVGEQRVLLKDHSDIPFPRRQLRHILTVDVDAPPINTFKTGKRTQQS